MEIRDTVLFTFEQDIHALIAECEQDGVHRVLARYKPPGAKVLEAGAGSGRWLAFLASRGYQVVGIELNPESVARFCREFPGIHYDVGDVAALPYPDRSFDAVLSLGVIEHLIDGPRVALRELRRVLNDDGIAIITVPMNNFLWKLQRAKLRVWYGVLGSVLLRRLLGRKPISYTREQQNAYFQALRLRLLPNLDFMLSFDPREGVQFYEYRFKTPQLLDVLRGSGLIPIRVLYAYSAMRLVHVFGSLVGQPVSGRGFRLNALGSFLRFVLPQTWTAHMIMVVVRKG